MLRSLLLVLTALLPLAGPVSPTQAADPPAKAIWGPVAVNGESQFPIYRELGVGLWQAQLQWDRVAPTEPATPTDPADPAYRWPAELDRAMVESAANKISVALMIKGSPGWANGGREAKFAPSSSSTYAAFAQAAAKRYPRVRTWIVWGEPTRRDNFEPLLPERRGKNLTAAQAKAPKAYARLLDAAYLALKRVSRKNRVVGGMTFTTGDISPRNWIKNLKLPNGRPPRMDLYGHNAFSGRKPDLKKPPLANGFADFSDLDTLGRWIDRYLDRRSARAEKRSPIKIFVSEFTLPTDKPNYVFNFWVDRKTQANWIRAALRITKADRRIATFGYYQLRDQRPMSDGREANWGLIDATGQRKPAFSAYRAG